MLANGVRSSWLASARKLSEPVLGLHLLAEALLDLAEHGIQRHGEPADLSMSVARQRAGKDHRWAIASAVCSIAVNGFKPEPDHEPAPKPAEHRMTTDTTR